MNTDEYFCSVVGKYPTFWSSRKLKNNKTSQNSIAYRQIRKIHTVFGKIQNVGESGLSEEKNYCFIVETFHVSFSYIFFVYMDIYALYIYVFGYIRSEFIH